MNKLNLIDQRFGRLIAIRATEKRKNGKIIWLCKCDCGNSVEIRSSALKHGDIKSCGCLQKEIITRIRFKHGEEGTRLYIIWSNMKLRCLNKNNPAYKRYGERGIEICDEWKNDFLAFRFWAILNGYQDHLTIDRIDNDGDYEPNNCQFLTKPENSRKGRRSNYEKENIAS